MVDFFDVHRPAPVIPKPEHSNYVTSLFGFTYCTLCTTVAG